MRKTIFFIPMAAVAAALCFTACSSDKDELADMLAQQENSLLTEEPSVSSSPFAISIDEAQKTLEEILAKEDGQGSTTRGAQHQRRIKNRFASRSNKVATRSAGDSDQESENPLLYVFNFEDNEGFAVMGADKRGAPLLALTESGEFTPGMTTDNLGFAISMSQAVAAYSQMIVEAGSDTVYNTNGFVMTATVKDSITVNKNGQCQVRWGQGSPYNRYCPTGCPTGCTATAVAQLMSIFKYPSSFGAITFDWDTMIEYPLSTDISQLMLLLGLPGNLNMNYTSTGSGAKFENVTRTLQNFGYSHSGICADYNADVVMNHVLAGLPVLLDGYETYYVYNENPQTTLNYGGYISSGTEGHAWLADGGKIITMTTQIHNFLTGEHAVLGPTHLKYVHCNFGWDGEFNGLYLCNHHIDAPDKVNNDYPAPGITTIYDNNFQYNCNMVTGIAQ